MLKRARIIIYLVIIVSITIGTFAGVQQLFHAIPHAGIGIDDANIFFVYGRNVSQGYGFVYNAGGERVEGFTSLAWALICAGAFLFSHSERFLLLANGLIVSLALALLVLRLARQENNGQKGLFVPLGALAVLGWVFTAPEYFSWCVVSLMETGLWSASLILCLCCLSGALCGDRRWRALFPAALGGLLLVRPESIAWGAGFTVLYFLLTWLQAGRFTNALRRTLPPVVVYGTVLAGLTAFRLLYFGFPFPNTYYAKVSPDRLYSLQEGWNYFSAFLETNGWLTWLLAGSILVVMAWSLAGFVSLCRRRMLNLNEWDVMAYGCAVTSLIGMLIPIWVGGDHFASFRFYQPVWPILPVPLIYLFTRTAQWAGRRAQAHLPAGLVSVGIAGINLLLALILARSFLLSGNAQWNQLEKTNLYVDFEVANDGRLFGETLNRLFEGMPAPSMGAITAGGFKLTYQGEVIDLMGLNNVAMGHAPGERKGIKNHAAFNKDIFYRLRPDIMPLEPATPEEIGEQLTWNHPQVQRCVQHRWARLPLKDLFMDDAFHNAYTLVYLSRRDAPSTAPGLLAFAENRFLDTLYTNKQLSLIRETVDRTGHTDPTE